MITFLIIAAVCIGLLSLTEYAGEIGPREVAVVANSPLADTHWKVVSIQDKPVILKGNGRDPHMVLRAKDHRVNAYGGVNSFGGKYQQSGRKLTFTTIFGTKMAGTKPLNDQENAFASTLANANGYSIAGDILTIKQDGVAVMVMKAKIGK